MTPLTEAQAVLAHATTEDDLGELIRDACAKLGWRFLWLRKIYHSSAGILDLQLIPTSKLDIGINMRRVLFRELKGYRKNGKLGELTIEQVETIRHLKNAGYDAGVWTPDQSFDGTIERELL